MCVAVCGNRSGNVIEIMRLGNVYVQESIKSTFAGEVDCLFDGLDDTMWQSVRAVVTPILEGIQQDTTQKSQGLNCGRLSCKMWAFS